MTREVAKELLPIIQAFAEGKTIQQKVGYEETWVDVNLPSWEEIPSNYRIKPEPKYRPFQTQEEYWDEAPKHNKASWVKHKTRELSKHITKIKEDLGGNVWFDTTSLSGVELFSARQMFDYFEFMDGAPFGVKEKEL